MKKAVILFVLSFLVFSFPGLLAQKMLHSQKDMITIRFNEYAIAWHLQPEINPDVFTVGSTFKTKKISIITASDSASFTVNAGQQVNLIVYLNNVPCHILVDVLDDPLFLHWLPGALAIIVTVCAVFFAGKSKGWRSARNLLALGAVAPVLFWITTITAGWIHGNYNHLHNAVSELGTIGTRSEYFMAVCTLLIGILAIVFSIGFFKASRALGIAALPAILSFSMAVSLVWAAVFSSGHELHGSLGPLPLFMMLGVLVAVLAWPGTKGYKQLRIHSAVALLIMCLFFFRFVPNILQGYEGALQRCMYAGWSYWYIAVSISLRRKLLQAR